MSDSFADLWSSSAPLPPKPKPQTLSSATTSFTGNSASQRPVNTTRTNAKPDVFTLLASSGSSSPAPRYGGGTGLTGSSAANLGSSAPSSRAITPGMSRSNSSTPAPAAASSSSGDAFSDIFSSSTGNTSNGSTKMTLAARLAMESQQRGRSPGLQSGLGQQHAKQQDGAGYQSSAWAGLDSLAAGGLGGSKAGTSNPAVIEDDDWGLGDFGAPTTKAMSTTKTASTSRSTPQPQPQQKKATTLWDLDDFASSPPPAHTGSDSDLGSLLNDIQRPVSRSASSQGTRNKPQVPASSFLDNEGLTSPDTDFDFGNREDRVDEARRHHAGKGRQNRGGLLNLDGEDDHGYSATRKGLLDDDGDGDDGWGQAPTASRGGRGVEDDLLGMLGQPVEVVRAAPTQDADHAPSRNGRSNPTRSHGSRPGASSPPPHILGQIVEMGFSIEQAKKALKQTKDGQDVQAALESLLGGGDPAEESRSGGGGYAGEREHPRPSNSSPAPPPAHPRTAPKGQKERERERLERQRQASLREGGEGSGSGSVTDIQEQADKLLAQASEIGLTVFSKASAFWKGGKEKVVKAYEERSGDVGGRGGAPAAGGGGRPKWMQEVVHQSDDEDDSGRNHEGFRDTHDQEEVFPRRPNVKVEQAEVDLFSDPAPQRSTPFSQSRPNSIRQTSSSSQPQQRKAPQQRQPTQPPPPPPTRNLPTASPSALAIAMKHKTAGTEQFKLGQHAAAVESYSAAIAALPDGHLLLIPLHTNRALSRLKTGEYVGAVADCEKAVEGVLGKLVFSSGAGRAALSNDDGFGFDDPLAPKKDASPSAPPPLLQPSIIPPGLLSAGRSRVNEGGWMHPQGVGVDLLDGYVKALRRAAEACEGREKWVDAGLWWSVLSRAGEGEGGGWVEEKTRKEAVSGGVRCRKMLDQASGSGASSSPVAGLAKAAGPASVSRPPTKPKPKPRPPPAPSNEPSRALLALQNITAQAESEDAAKHALKDMVDARLSAWKTGKETNVRALLASLETVLWEGAITGGLKMGMADLVSPAQVKKGYVRAIAKVHPDKEGFMNSGLTSSLTDLNPSYYDGRSDHNECGIRPGFTFGGNEPASFDFTLRCPNHLFLGIVLGAIDPYTGAPFSVYLHDEPVSPSFPPSPSGKDTHSNTPSLPVPVPVPVPEPVPEVNSIPVPPPAPLSLVAEEASTLDVPELITNTLIPVTKAPCRSRKRARAAADENIESPPIKKGKLNSRRARDTDPWTVETVVVVNKRRIILVSTEDYYSTNITKDGTTLAKLAGYICRKCDHRARVSGDMRKHVESHYAPQWHCKDHGCVCSSNSIKGSSFTRKSAMVVHMKDEKHKKHQQDNPPIV
ncbi:hypothetical protein GALMADRAFT_137751 [Galerina marginata CBS 339.88]|uniref:UBA domain-containing protein n=1 Tax=Galerina marginata (strain CBS 339.88) TaxID=685588 RepID=A0A067T8P6_GALM3|nr:hypothetical protein GALMADRAFT_137751 [Galerina marginata CBS 339.88]